MLEQYQKAALSFEQQIDHLISRNLIVRDRASAVLILSSTNYYRFSAYWFPFRMRDATGLVTGHLVPGTTFEAVVELYEFDRQLRLFVLDAIERVEVALRTQIALYVA